MWGLVDCKPEVKPLDVKNEPEIGTNWEILKEQKIFAHMQY